MTARDWLIETIGIVGFVTNVAANILIARKSDRGWTVRLVCNAIWLVYSIFAFSIANFLNSITFAFINVYGLRRWKREKRDERVAKLAASADQQELAMYRARDRMNDAPQRPARPDMIQIEERQNWHRASGSTICEHCSCDYYAHASVRGYTWLTRLCDGRLVKL